MIPGAAVFAIPGDPDARTGGYIYEKSVLIALRRMGRPVRLLRLPDGLPTPSPGQARVTGDALAALSDEIPVILDGFVVGALDPEQFARIRAPFVAMIHHPLALETGLAPERAAWLERTETLNLARAGRVVVPSPRTRADLVARYGVPAERIAIAPPGVNRPAAPLRAADPPLILSVGTLVPRKGHDVLLEALAQINDLRWQARIVGAPRDPAVAATLRAQAGRLGLDDRLKFLGEVPDAKLSDLYRAARVFALATRLEGYGMVFAEALAHGLPIVTCYNTAIPDVVPADSGALVPTDDPTAFAGALRRFLTDEDAHRRAAAGAHAAGALLPCWPDTAAVMAQALDLVSAEAGLSRV